MTDDDMCDVQSCPFHDNYENKELVDITRLELIPIAGESKIPALCLMCTNLKKKDWSKELMKIVTKVLLKEENGK